MFKKEKYKVKEKLAVLKAHRGGAYSFLMASIGFGIVGIVLFTPKLWATNGYKVEGFGYRVGTAGAGVALPMDATDAALNPALLTGLESQFFISAGVFHPDRFMDTSQAPLGNPAGHSTSRHKNFLDGSAGIIYRPSGSWSYGLAITGSGGMNTAYPNSRINPGFLGGFYDTGVAYRILNFNPAVAYQTPWKNISFGITPILSYADIKTDVAVPNGVGGFQQTTGQNQKDRAWGYGLRLGATWTLTDSLAFAVAGQTPTKYQRFKKYPDAFANSFDFPPVYAIGLSFTPRKGTTFLLDYEFIQHTKTKILSLSPEAGGFGWEDMHVIRIGCVQKIYDFTLRCGYNYGRSPIRSNRVFANVIAPAVVEHHFAAGLSYAITPQNILSLSGYYVPLKELTESGTGGMYSSLGKGTRIGMKQFGVQVAYQKKF